MITPTPHSPSEDELKIITVDIQHEQQKILLAAESTTNGFTIPSPTKSSNTISPKPTITQNHIQQFKTIIEKFIEDTAPKIKATKRDKNGGYEAIISKNEVLLTSYPEDRLRDPISHKFICRQLTLINQRNKQ